MVDFNGLSQPFLRLWRCAAFDYRTHQLLISALSSRRLQSYAYLTLFERWAWQLSFRAILVRNISADLNQDFPFLLRSEAKRTKKLQPCLPAPAESGPQIAAGRKKRERGCLRGRQTGG